ncbi:choice-of-anchor Q domain-containing protein [Tautonia plasticadhaerens]|uniref:Uncharacterized protein n=1 Tax=Tautonia plasticadhaerens TaxID=2527974 RepID=A0A518HBG6_9BACT|nr:choice-of-anchor Q domain-containing protein [Tautonia plasticadhaerens]QDV38203.1 hypothetical protein ElP_61540 [Tautonia plasticadhaerens]
MPTARASRAPRRLPRASRPRLEGLEPRSLLATFTVTGLDDAGPGSLREAIERANLDPDRDTIAFEPGLSGTIELASALPELATAVIVAGPGADVLSVSRSRAEGIPAFRILTVPEAADVEVEVTGLTLSGGVADAGGGVLNAGTLTLSGVTVRDNRAGADAGAFDASGGGIANSGTLTIADSSIVGNSAQGGEGSAARGSASGGGISNSGILRITGSSLTDNEATPGVQTIGASAPAAARGGGIENSGTLTIADSTLERNSAVPSGPSTTGVGGGIANVGTATASRVTFRENRADTRGGGLANDGEAVVEGATFRANRAGEGGGIANLGSVMMSDTLLADNLAEKAFPPNFADLAGSSGGAVYSSGTLRVFGSTFLGNAAISTPSSGGLFTSASGGAVANLGAASISGSTFEGNSADAEISGGPSTGASARGGAVNNEGSLIVSDSAFSGNRVDASGGTGNDATGGALNSAGSLTLSRSLFRDNRASSGGIRSALAAGGALAVRVDAGGIVTVSESTFAGNEAAGGSGFGPAGRGGAIAILGGGAATVVNSTLSGNRATSGGAISTDGDLTLAFSTLADNTGGTVVITTIPPLPQKRLTIASNVFGFGADGGGSIVNQGSEVASQGGNLFADAPEIPLAPSDLVSVDPRLGPLADNGGPTPTRALLPGSPAIDVALPVAGVTTDQRGVPRPQSTAPDAGAFEAELSTALVASPGSTSPTVGQDVEILITLTGPDGAPLGGVPAAARVVSGPNAGAEIPATPTGPDGRIRFVYTGIGGPGTDTIVASAAPTGVASTVVSPASTVTWALRPPTVLGLRRLGYHARPTRLVLAFSTAMDPARAEDLANYRLVLDGPDRLLRITSASYDEATRTVTLSPSRRLPLPFTYRLTVVGTPPGGLTSSSGVPLDGDGSGQPGSDFTATFGREALDRPTPLDPASRLDALRLLLRQRRDARRSGI